MTNTESISINTGAWGKENLHMDHVTFKNSTDPALKVRIQFTLLDKKTKKHINRYTEVFLNTKTAQDLYMAIVSENDSFTFPCGPDGKDTIAISPTYIREKDCKIKATRLEISRPPLEEGKKPFRAITSLNYASLDIVSNYIDNWLIAQGINVEEDRITDLEAELAKMKSEVGNE